MHPVAIFLVVCASSFLVVVSGKVSGDDGGCREPPAVEKFAASFYAAIIVSNDPKFVNNFSIEGGEAGMHVYNVVKRILEEFQLCDADEIAFIAGRAVAKGGALTLPAYFRNVAYTAAKTLYKAGILDCDSAIKLALEYFGYVQVESKGLDKTQFETYVTGMVKGWRDMLRAHNLGLDENFEEAANQFYQAYDQDKGKPKCQFEEDDQATVTPK